MFRPARTPGEAQRSAVVKRRDAEGEKDEGKEGESERERGRERGREREKEGERAKEEAWSRRIVLHGHLHEADGAHGLVR